jgi:D-alanyl-D-alanine carboxypeptidase/D-alanyl-D-alanine-endopeptidase (penicillin-binding protein 4)
VTVRRGGVDPLVVVGALAVIPALLLWMVWGWASGRAAVAEDGVPPTESSVPPPEPLPGLSTQLLSLRRSASQLSRDLNLSAFESAVVPLLDAVNDRSCAAVSLDGRLVGERNPDVVVIPASNEKLLVAAVAEQVLGSDFVYTTTVVGPEPVGGVIDGDVYLVGGGDPLLSGDWYATAELDRFQPFNLTSIDALVTQLTDAGVSQIAGTVRGDGSRYDDEWYAPGWGGGVAGLEAGPYDALLVNDSRVLGDEQRGADPNETGAREFVRILAAEGIVVTGGAATGSAPANLSQLASIDSLPLPAVIAEMLANSDNNTAELMVKEIGLVASGAGTRVAGLEAIADTIAGWGIDVTGLSLGDGSGLSLDNRITCTTLLGVLQHVGFDSATGQGLAVAGEAGTLVDIFGETPVAGRLRGKTGTLNNPPFDQDPPAVKALSGFLPVDGGGAIEYVLLLNGPTISDQSEYRSVWAELVTALDSFPAVASPATLGPR